MRFRNVIHKGARLALTRTQGRRAASWLIMAACLGAMMLLWGVSLPWWVFAAIVVIPFAVLFCLGNYWAGQDGLAAERARALARSKSGSKSTAKTANKSANKPKNNYKTRPKAKSHR